MRGIAILISKCLSSSLFQTSKVSENIAGCHIKTGKHSIYFINVYMPGDKRSANEFDKFGTYLTILLLLLFTIVVGDFNAHVGIKDLTPGDAKLIGKNLFHEKNNDNGTDLKNLLYLTQFNLKKLPNAVKNSQDNMADWRKEVSVRPHSHI